MKKSLKVILLTIISILLMGYITVSYGATKQDVIDFLSQPFVISGEETYVPKEYIKEAERYLSTHDVTESQADEIIARAKEGINILINGGQKDAKKLPYAKKQELLTKFQDAVAVNGAKATYVNGYIIVSDENNKVFGKYPVEMETRSSFAQTGSNNIGIYVLLGTAIVGVLAFYAFRRKN